MKNENKLVGKNRDFFFCQTGYLFTSNLVYNAADFGRMDLREVPKRCSRKLSSSTNRLVNINPACNLSRGKNSNLYKRNNKLELTLNTKSKKLSLILILR